jgi:hypothetical protein
MNCLLLLLNSFKELIGFKELVALTPNAYNINSRIVILYKNSREALLYQSVRIVDNV